jgi:serine/threonine-protein phosphatase 5
VANTAILHHSDALRDWKVVVKKNPSDKNAKLQFSACDKAVKRDAFLKAIEIGDAPSAAEGLDVDSMTVDADYDGVKLEKEMTQEFIDDMIKRFKDGKQLPRKYVFQIILAVRDIVFKEPTMVETEVKEGHKLTVCGDTHGTNYNNIYSLRDLLTCGQDNFTIFLRYSD